MPEKDFLVVSWRKRKGRKMRGRESELGIVSEGWMTRVHF